MSAQQPSGRNPLNPADPLARSVPAKGYELFQQVSRLSSGFPGDEVADAGINLFVNILRQTHPSRKGAEARFDELMGKAKALLLEHYDSVTGKRRNIFPFTQSVRAQHVDGSGQH